MLHYSSSFGEWREGKGRDRKQQRSLPDLEGQEMPPDFVAEFSQDPGPRNAQFIKLNLDGVSRKTHSDPGLLLKK